MNCDRISQQIINIKRRQFKRKRRDQQIAAMRSFVSFTFMLCVLVLAMLSMPAESSYGQKPAPPMVPSPSPTPSGEGGHFGGPKTPPPPPNDAAFAAPPLLIPATMAISLLAFVF